MAAIIPTNAAYAADGPAMVLEEITVTAQKRSQRLVDVPISVSAFGDEAIKATGVQQLSEISDLIPNLHIDSVRSLSSSVTIRGVGASSRNIGFDARVGVYLDGVYLGQSPALNQDMVDMERIEVLRGPQGALFGKNTVAGAINMISKKPSDELEGMVRARVGNYNATQFSGHINLPLTEGVALKVSANKVDRDGYSLNLLDNIRTDDRDSYSYRAQLRIATTDNFEVLATVDGLSADEYVTYGDPLTNSFGSGLDTSAPNERETNFNHVGEEQRDIFGVSLDMTYSFGNDYALRSITAYRKTDFHTKFDVDYAPIDFMYVDYTDNYKQITEEVQLISPEGDALEYIIGLYFFKQEGKTNRLAIAGEQGYLLGLASGDTISNAGEVISKSFALFSNFTYDITDRIELGVGFRWSSEKKDVDWTLDGSQSGPLGIASGHFVHDRTDNNFAPSLSLNYAITDQITSYLRYAEGYKSGGYNLDYITLTPDAENTEFGKETVVNYEAGIKGSLMENRMTFALSAFLTEYKEYQVNQLRELSGGRSTFVISNAGKVRTKGIELETTVYVTDGLKVSGSLGILDAIFTDFPGGGTGGADVSGNDLPNASKFQGSVAADYYRFLGGSMGLAIKAHLDYSHRSGAFTTVNNVKSYSFGSGSVPYGYVPAYDLMNARLTLLSEDQGWEVSLWARNLLDNNYINRSSRDFFNTYLETRGAPRTYGAEVSYTF
ncbi:MAG: TonB-dependent receptor [Alphaproteobacteria bacterium]|nr:MAG: TonB-dependent receptor [Alphaproteobacteria bacterium]